METTVAYFLVEHQIYLNMIANKCYHLEEDCGVWLYQKNIWMTPEELASLCPHCSGKK